MIKTGLISGLIYLFLTSISYADVPAYEMVPDKSTLKFIAIQNNAPVEGEFKTYTADIRFDPSKLAESKIIVEVNMGSMTASYDEVTNNLKLPEWLSIEKFPKARFESTKITRMPMSDIYIVDGELSLRDKKLPTTLNFQMMRFDNTLAIAKGSTTLHRKDFGIGQGQWAKDDVIKDEVHVEFRIVANKK